MYEAIKKWIKPWVPKQWLFKNEQLLRSVLAMRYRGNCHGCNVCGVKLREFVALANGELLCPACGSLPRNRRLWQLLTHENLLHGHVLDFSPSRCLSRKMRAQKGIRYTSSDFVGEFEAEKSHDITAIAEAEGQFDLVICFHVLEHVDDDQQAMQELYRVLKPGGKVLIQTPFKDGDTYENPNVTTPAGRLEHFGQEDHVRVYSAHGLAQRLRNAGFSVEISRFDKDAFLGMKENETVLIATKEG